MEQNYLQIARDYVAALSVEGMEGMEGKASKCGVTSTIIRDTSYDERVEANELVETADVHSAHEINEKNEISPSSQSFRSLPAHPLFAGLWDSTAEPLTDEACETSPVGTAKAVRDELQQLQAWLSTIEWSNGLRCGITGRQCKHCRGVPCRGSTEWIGGSTLAAPSRPT